MANRLKSRCTALLVVSLLGIATTSESISGPYADFERALRGAYAPYRAALLQTNQKDRAGTEKSLAAFEAAWSKLMESYRAAPPPQYADDPQWHRTVSSIDETIASAKAETAKGDLAKAHDVLEAVRDRLGELRARNGVITFSDRVDAYHERMEHTLAAKYTGSEGAAMLRENAAVLVHLSGLIERHAPLGLKENDEFKESLAAMIAATNALQNAARIGDAAAIEKALKALKPAYARLFVKFG